MTKIENKTKDNIVGGSISISLILAISGAVFSAVNLIGGIVTAVKQVDYAKSIELPKETYVNSNFLQNNSINCY